MASIIQSRRDTAANWAAENPILAQGEKGYETDSISTEEAKYKIGDGVTSWLVLPYQISGKVKSVNGEEGIVVLDTSDIADTTDKRYVTDAEKVVISNTSNTNTGDQDLSNLQPILSEGAFVDGDKTKLDNQSGTNTGDQDISGIGVNASDITTLQGETVILQTENIAQQLELNSLTTDKADKTALALTDAQVLNNTNAITPKIEATNYATFDTGGTVKMSRDTSTSSTYISFDGSDTPNVT